MAIIDRMGRSLPAPSRGLGALLVLVMLAWITAPLPALAYHFTLLDSFCTATGCPDGSQPVRLIPDGADLFYGTTLGGGANGYGAVFQLSRKAGQAAWTASVPYSFCPKTGCHDGQGLSGLVMDGAGTFYGTVAGGGVDCRHNLEQGCGAVIRLSESGGKWTETVIYAFCAQTACADGAQPATGVIVGGKNLLYGTTLQGGAHGQGTVFALTTDKSGAWVESVLHSFCIKSGCPDGSAPSSGLLADGTGNVYGTTAAGGANGQGTVFKVTGQSETVAYSFCGLFQCDDGGKPLGGVMRDTAGRLYATTSSGGVNGQGTVVQLALKSGHYAATVLYPFCGAPNCADGAAPAGSLILDGAGHLFGTTTNGGAAGNYDGAVFELTPPKVAGTFWGETLLHSFCTSSNCKDGETPSGQLLIDGAGNLYGTATAGGGHGNGVVWELAK